MIKKVNVALAIAFAALFALKGLKMLVESRGRESAAPAAAAVRETSTLAPHVYYFNWVRFSVENRIANRNGVLLDVVRAIFPDAEFRHLRGDVPAFAKIMQEDPRAVVVGYGRHPSLDGASEVSDVPLAYSKLALMTQRSNPWRYRGVESLAGLRIVSDDDFLDYPLVQRILSGQESGCASNPPTVKVMYDKCSREILARMVESGEADAFFATHEGYGALPEQISTRIIQRFRMSDEIDRGDVLLHVSKIDPEFAAAVIAEYEKGMKRIGESGELRRIFEYYGMKAE